MDKDKALEYITIEYKRMVEAIIDQKEKHGSLPSIPEYMLITFEDGTNLMVFMEIPDERSKESVFNQLGQLVAKQNLSNKVSHVIFKLSCYMRKFHKDEKIIGRISSYPDSRDAQVLMLYDFSDRKIYMCLTDEMHNDRKMIIGLDELSEINELEKDSSHLTLAFEEGFDSYYDIDLGLGEHFGLQA